MGHYKVAARHSPLLSTIHAKMITIPFQQGYAPQRWRKAVQVMLEKDKHSPKINRLRIIQILEADLNLGYRLIWGKRMVESGETSNALHNSQYGARKSKDSTAAAFNKVLTYDIARQQRTNLCIFYNDAKGCFDRIVPSLAALACRRLGLPKKTARLMTEVLSLSLIHI